MRTRLTIVLAAAAAALALAPAAEAKVWFESMGGQRVEPFALVSTEVAGCNGVTACLPELTGLRIYSRSVGPPRPKRCARLERFASAGRLSHKATLRLRAPKTPGRYELMAALTDTTACYPVVVSP